MTRKQLRRSITIGFGFVALLAGLLNAAPNNGRTAAAFLQVSPGARAAGLGGAFSAVAEGALAASWNPSGLATSEQSEVFFSHFSWYQDITVEHGAISFPVSDNSSLGASVTYLNYGTIDGFDASGQSTGELSAYDMSAGLSYGLSFTEQWSVGVTAKYIRQQLADYSGSAFAGDFGVKYSLARMSLAATFNNFGNKITFDNQAEDLPATARFGLAVRPFNDGFLAALDVSKELKGGLKVYQGVELGFGNQYYIRSGFSRLVSDPNRSIIGSMSVGLGVRLDMGELDYSFTPQDNVTSDGIHRFSLLLRFGE